MRGSTGNVAIGDIGLGEVIEFMRLLWAVDHGLEASSKQMDIQLGVTGPQRLVIRVVGRRPGISAGQLAEILHVHPSTLTGVLSRLVERSILTRRPDPTDGRRALFGLTIQGKKLDDVRNGTVEAKLRRALGKLGPRDVASARRVLSAIADSLAPAKTSAGTQRSTVAQRRAADKRATGKRAASA